MTARDALLTPDDLARRWQVPTSQVYRLARDGRIPSVQLGKYRRFRLDEVERFETQAGRITGPTS